MNATFQQLQCLFQQGTADDNDRGGAIAGDDILRLGELDEHLGGGLCNTQLVEDGGTIVGDDDLLVCGGHLGVESGSV